MAATVQEQVVPMIDPRHMRKVLGHVPTSVAIVCTMDVGKPVGCTIGSFVSVSLDPALIAFFAMKSSSTFDSIARAGSFSVNVLAGDQSQVCDVFARKLPDRFRQVGWTPGPGGNPHLRGSLAVLDCEVDSILTLGDHEMVVGRVEGLMIDRPGVEPLVFSRGALRGLSSDQRTGRHPYAWLDE